MDEKKVKQVSEFEKKEKLDLNEIAALIDKKKENLAETKKKLIRFLNQLMKLWIIQN